MTGNSPSEKRVFPISSGELCTRLRDEALDLEDYGGDADISGAITCREAADEIERLYTGILEARLILRAVPGKNLSDAMLDRIDAWLTWSASP